MEDDVTTPGFADVLLDNPSRQLDRPFTYGIPPALAGQVGIGSVVVVPFINSFQVGYVLALRDQAGMDGVKEISRLVDEPPVFNPETVELCAWMAERYLTPLSQVFRLITPPGRARTLVEEVRLLRGGEEGRGLLHPRAQRACRVLEALEEAGGCLPLKSLKSRTGDGDLGSTLRKMEGLGLVERVVHLSRPRVDAVSVMVVRLEGPGREWLAVAGSTEELPEGKAPTPLQRRVLEVLEERGGRVPQGELVEESSIGYPSLRSMARRGLVSIGQEERQRDPFSHMTFARPPDVVLNRDQAAAFDEIRACLADGSHRSFLLHGITGSGKTEVYLRSIRVALELGKTAIVLVPEISLTPQMVERFKGTLGDTVAVLHSGLGLGERYDQWRGIRDGTHRVVIGARSALFAPLRDLGLIVIDEEHETTYKESVAPRYHAREVAACRARLNSAALVLGSATPQLETVYRARQGELANLVLPRRIDDRPLPRIEVVDMREANQPGTAHHPQHPPGQRPGQHLRLGRAGHPLPQPARVRALSPVPPVRPHLPLRAVLGEPLLPPKRDALLCHYCDATLTPPFICPGCGSESHRYSGVGTERVEAELHRLLPSIKCLRMDADTTRQKHSHWRILDDFKARKAQVLLGTQMIAKGLDFPTVTLVGVINADTSLDLPDFRAAERTFQLLTQVSGRAGRGELPGRVIIQTFSPENYAIESCVRGDDEGFYLHELAWRREAGYPPFLQVVNLVFTSPREEAALQASRSMLEILSRLLPGDTLEVLGPAAAPISRIKGRYRYHLLLKAADLAPLMRGLREALPEFERARAGICREYGLKREGLSLVIDVDPTTLL